MNRKTIRLLTDMILSILVASLLEVFISFGINSSEYKIHLGLIPLVWLALRYGPSVGLINGGVLGLVVGGYDLYKNPSDTGVSYVILAYVLAYGVSGWLSGLFAKYTQKTLNNARYKSSYLNITTASLLASLTYYLLNNLLIGWILNKSILDVFKSGLFWLNLFLAFLLTAVLLCILAKSNKKLFIPRGTKYLSRRETSSLLND